MLRALAKGEDNPRTIADLARGKLKSKRPELERALHGQLTKAQRWVLAELLNRYDELTAAQGRVNERITQELANSADPFVEEAVQLLDTIPGVGQETGQAIISEIGTDMTRFPDDRHLASWAGVCPGNHRSAGKRLSGKTRHGNKHLRTALVQAAWAASHTKDTYLAAQYRRFAKRKGKKKALIAVSHSILVIAYNLLKKKATYQELGGDYFDRLHQHDRQLRLINQLQAMGLKVTVESLPEAA
jgi:transposase